METLQQVPDPRAQNTQFRIGSVLAIVAMAILSGHREIAAIYRFGWRLKQAQRAKLSLPLKRGTRIRKIPSYNVYYQVLSQLDLDAFARILGEWLQAQAGSLPCSLAMDGKMIRETVGVLSLVDHDTGVPQTMTTISKKKGNRKKLHQHVKKTMASASPLLNTQNPDTDV